MANVTVDVRLRPIRLAFLVRPNDSRRLLDIFKINTCLWGGRFNPIIPYFKQVPKWWDRHNFNYLNAKQIINGYLDFYEPDFLVEAEQGLSDGFGFNNDRILSLDSVLIKEGDRNNNGYGQSVIDLYRYLYDTDYKFTHRNPDNTIDVNAEDPNYSGFAACLFGAFPESEELNYFHRGYRKAFAPRDVALNSNTYTELLQSRFTSPLRIGRDKLDIQYMYHADPALYIMDAAEPRDLIDYWNLTTIKEHVIPIPIQWIDSLSDWCKEFIRSMYYPLPGNQNGVMHNAVSIFSRSIPSENIQQFYLDYLRVGVQGADVLQDHYPTIWQPTPDFVVRRTRPILSGDDKSYNFNLASDDLFTSFESLHPIFAEKYSNNYRWVNVINFREWSFNKTIATCFPCDYKDPKYPPFRTMLDPVLPTTEGLIAFPSFMNQSLHFPLSDGKTAIGDWLRMLGTKSTMSDGGRITQQVIQTIGGLSNLSCIAHEEIIKLLNSISNSPLSRTIGRQKLKSTIEHIIKDDTFRYQTFERLINNGVLELGLELKCEKCSSWSWYPINQLDYKLICTLCKQPFKFPITDPGLKSLARWAYRVIGPFALSDYASGGYASALSIRFFTNVLTDGLDSDITWSPGQLLEMGKDDLIEADFILWRQANTVIGSSYPTELIFGEAKSFGNRQNKSKNKGIDTFKTEDFNRLKKLAEIFPGSVLVFSTMKESNELTRSEISKLSALANWGRTYLKEQHRTRAPVIILTGTELFSPFHLHQTWEDKGGLHAQLAGHNLHGQNLLKHLADYTQQLYLNMQPYGDWVRERYEKRRARRDNRK